MSIHDQSLPEAVSFDLPVAPKSRMTEEDFVAWCFREDVRAEWVDGEVIIMSPTSTEHVDLFGFLIFLLRGFTEPRRLGKVLGSELFVRFPAQRRRRIPDILFVSATRQDLLRNAHFEGAPDMIMEIVSPDSQTRDWDEKYQEYEAAGVREYWVIDPLTERVELYVLANKRKYERIAEQQGWLISTAVPRFRLKIAWLWPATRPIAVDALAELNALQHR